MKKETKSWLLTFLAGFLATALGIIITFGIENRISASRRAETARLLAKQIVEKMERTRRQLHEYQEIYDTIDSTSMILHLAILADTLEQVEPTVVTTFINSALSEYVQVDVDNGMDAYKAEILNTIGNVELIGHIDDFYGYARQYRSVSAQVIDQKRVVADLVYAHFYGDLNATEWDYVRYLHELSEFNVYYSRMQNVRLTLEEIDKAMLAELDSCKTLLNSKTK
ncbi:MAG: hypothetical protein IJ064_00525 [Bacteroidaceae bacterium]|nr:hypothetical protein [Bacteroidaceae bacterium]